MPEGNIIYYLAAIIVGIVVSLIIMRVKAKGETKADSESYKVDVVKIQEYILPNNQGKPIDDVIERLKSSQVNVRFAVDLSKRRGETINE